MPVQVYYPAYYQNLLIRLYNFNGEAVTAPKPAVITYEERTDRKGNTFRMITDAQEFSSYTEAEAYLKQQGLGNSRIVGINPFVSPVPLEAEDDYRVVYSSNGKVNDPNAGSIPEVKIFEYVR